jgi:hypothetical protein
MVDAHAGWLDLPRLLRQAVQARVGTVTDARPVHGGQNSALALLLDTDHGRVFCKGIRSDERGRVLTQRSERLINPLVQHVSARLVAHLRADGWDLLVFTHIAGRHAELRPGSPDLPKITTVLDTIAAIEPPPSGLHCIEHRWRGYSRDADRLAGDRLLHTDLNPRNILVGSAARIVDWAWPTLGAAWIDTACLALQLIAAGHHPAQAENWAKTTSTWRHASDDAITVFLKINTRMWHQIASADPQPWKTASHRSALRWATFHKTSMP